MSIGRLWPRERLPGLRTRLVQLYQLNFSVLNRAQFEMWSRMSALRYGERRWIDVDGQSLKVRSDDWRAFWIQRTQGTQPEPARVWSRLAHLARPELCVDVGANYGEFCVLLQDLEDVEVLALEPNPLIFECLRETLASHPRMRALNVAACAEDDEELELFVKRKMSGFSSLAHAVVEEQKTYAARMRDRTQIVRVRGRTLDALVPEKLGRAPRSLLLKVDVEGFEDLVFEGAQELLEQVDWWRAIVEFNYRALERRGVSPREVWERFADHSGIVIDTSYGRTPLDVDITQRRLPREPIRHGDLLIGRGSWDQGNET